MLRCAKNGGAARRRFYAIHKKPHGGGVQTPPPAGRGLSKIFGVLKICLVENFRLPFFPSFYDHPFRDHPLDRGQNLPPPPAGRVRQNTLAGRWFTREPTMLNPRAAGGGHKATPFTLCELSPKPDELRT